MPYMDLMDSQSNYPEFFANCHIPILPQRSLLPMVDLQDSTPNSSTAPVSPAKGSVQMMSCMKGLYCNYYKYCLRNLWRFAGTYFHEYVYGIRYDCIQLSHDYSFVIQSEWCFSFCRIDLYLFFSVRPEAGAPGRWLSILLSGHEINILLSGHPPSEESPLVNLLQNHFRLWVEM